MPGAKLPDLLANDLVVVFCGTAAGAESARLGQYYAHPRNLFWATLLEIGLTRRRLEPAEFRALLELGVGLTDIAKFDSGMDHRLASGSLGRDACDALRAKIDHYRPRILAFTSLRAGRAFLGRTAELGEQRATIGSTRLWVLPSPSPAARWNWDREEKGKRHWRALADAARPYMKL
jgi:double-stranded uracil-DNA glycosylase